MEIPILIACKEVKLIAEITVFVSLGIACGSKSAAFSPIWRFDHNVILFLVNIIVLGAMLTLLFR